MVAHITNCYERIAIILLTKLAQNYSSPIFSVLSVQLVTSGVDGVSRTYQLPKAVSRACLMVKLWNKKNLKNVNLIILLFD